MDPLSAVDPPAALDAWLPLIATLAAQRRDDRPLRLWVAGCGTGAQIWSLAILACEALGGLTATTPLRIIVTDPDAGALRLARQGRYPRTAFDAVPAALRARYVIGNGNGDGDGGKVRVVPALRQLCVFVVHDLLSPPPFLHLDLVSCRHALSHLPPPVQTGILRGLHQALDDGGRLLLAPSDAVNAPAAGFAAEPGPWPLHRRQPAGSAGRDEAPAARQAARQATPQAASPPTSPPTSPADDPPRLQHRADLARLEELVAERTHALADKERQLQTILEGMPGLVAYWDADLVLRYANHQHRTRLVHEGENGGIGMAMEAMIGPERMAFVRPHVDRVLSGHPTRYEVGPVTAPGRTGDSWFMVHYVPDLREGTVVGFIAMGFDITEVKQAQTAAADASRAKSDFLASMSHEIRTPLNAVLGLAQVGARRCAGQAPAPVFAQIMQSGQHLLSLIDHILDFSKIEAGKVELQQVPVALDLLVERALTVVRPLATAQGLRLNVTRDPALAPAYLGDPVRLTQILINLLTNAVKFTTHGRVDLRLSARDGGGLVMSVTDTGVGMAPEIVARLFEPFERGDGSITRRVGGTGLGLSITRRLIGMMGGVIRVHSTPGQGSRFEVSLPLTAVCAEQLPADLDARWPTWLQTPETDGQARATPEDPARLPGVRVLVAEDHPVNRMVLAHVLEQEGARMVAVDNGLAAVEAVRRTPAAFDIVLCDIEMPGLDGYETTRRIHGLNASLPVIGLTAHAFDAARHRGREAGMADYVTKPYLVDVLVQAIVQQLPARRRSVPAPAAITAPDPRPLSRAAADPQADDDPWRIDGDTLLAHYRVGPDFLPRLLARVRDSLAQEPARLQAAWDDGDLEGLRGLAHGIVGMAAHLLLPALQARARALELALTEAGRSARPAEAGTTGDTGTAPRPLAADRIEPRLRALLQGLQAVQQRLPPP
ncbi:MAG: hypothetical protein RIQ53_3133 [Pseudomonadota bacterium]|jgi:signal transduction histidine kinase/DNA-binding response OmpR family regulator